MYIVTIREKGKDKPLLERECDCVIGAFGSAGEAHCMTGIQGKRQTLISTYASAHIKSDRRTLVRTYAGVLVALKAQETEFPGLVDEAVETAKNAELVEDPDKPYASLFLQLFGR